MNEEAEQLEMAVDDLDAAQARIAVLERLVRRLSHVPPKDWLDWVRNELPDDETAELRRVLGDQP